MPVVPALLVRKNAVKRDSALQPGGRGARKLLVTDIYPAKEHEAQIVEWQPSIQGDKSSVQVMPDSEVAVFNQEAIQDRHFHRLGTEIYMVLEGNMVIEVEGEEYLLSSGDMIVVNREAIHEVRQGRTKFLCRVITLNCGGAGDKFVVDDSAQRSH